MVTGDAVQAYTHKNSSDDIIGSVEGPPTQHGGLYLHWPFCETKCGYCDFYSVPLASPTSGISSGGRTVDAVLDAVLLELQSRLERHDLAVTTVFLGGGTPTTLDSRRLELLTHAIRAHTAGDPVEEFTVEANPATLDADKAKVLVNAGVTRISIGAQSFHAGELAVLERLHVPGDIPCAVATARAAGITDCNLDLIFGICGQTLESWRQSLQRALELEPSHLACYGLTYEHGTALTKRLLRGDVVPCDENVEADMYLAAIDMLQSAGFRRYEISNFARDGRECRHNLIYWNNGPYIGVGPSAAGFVNGRRYKNIPNHAEYVRRIHEDGHAVVESEVVDGPTAAIETIMMQLRLARGVDLPAFSARTGINLLERCAQALQRLHRQGLFDVTRERLRLTRRGLLVADAVIAELASAIEGRPNLALPVVQTRRSLRGP